MIRNYLTTALRTLQRNWTYTLINVAGLTFGLACCLVLFLAIRYELSFDRHYAQSDRIYRLITHYTNSNGDGRNVGMPLPALAALRNDFPELKHQVTMLYDTYGALVRVTNQKINKFQESGGVVALVEPEYFQLFDYQWKSGNPETAVKNPNTVVLTERIARKYFGQANPMGKTLRVDNKLDFMVTGIVQNPPATSSVPFEVMLSFSTLRQNNTISGWDDWGSNYSGAQIYLALPPAMTRTQLERRLVSFIRKYRKPADAKYLTYELQPLTAIHFDTRTENSAGRTVSKRMIWAMALIGLFILFTACVNFINLATAQAIRRAKEVGVRKVLGSSWGQLVGQFLGETGMLTGIAIMLAFLLAYLSLPYVAELLDVKAVALILVDRVVAGFLVLLALLTTVLAGFYPALLLSGYQPVTALRGTVSLWGQSAFGINQFTLRQGLIVLQFAISQMLIIGTLVAYNQMNFFRSADLGYHKDAVLTVNIPEQKPGQLASLRAKLAGHPLIKSLSYGISIPSSNGNWWTNFAFGNAAKEADFGIVMRFADTAYLNTYGLKLLAGRMYLPGDTTRELIVNESFARKMGFRDPRQILGKFVALYGAGNPKKPIVGVVRDFNTFSLHQATNPSVLTTRLDAYHTLGIKLSTQPGSPEAISRLLRDLETAWSATFPDFVFKYEFLDQTLADFYAGEARIYSLFRLLAGIAIFIGCLGLYGVVAFMAETRTKEIGVRKVLGASVGSVVALLSKDFLKLVLVAIIIASPLAYYAMNRWLADFAYRIDISWWVFALAGLLGVSIALLTVSFQSIRAALVNPVDSLRSD